MNYQMLLDKIESRNLSKTFVAEFLGLTRQGFYNKLNGERDFKGSEIKQLIRLLDLNTEEQQAIFFADDVGKNVTAIDP